MLQLKLTVDASGSTLVAGEEVPSVVEVQTMEGAVLGVTVSAVKWARVTGRVVTAGKVACATVGGRLKHWQAVVEPSTAAVAPVATWMADGR